MKSDAKTIMVQGTASDAGKSMLVMGICRCLHRRRVKVAPFKPQNMALNSAVTADGGEIGRAQAVQALAAGVLPCVDMNPILLKPSSDTGAQVIVHGKAIGNMQATPYHQYKTLALQYVLESHQNLSTKYDVIVVEGAGSPAEVNLRDRDIANMGFAEEVDCPVILIADIDKGGVFAQLVGTLALLSASEQNRVIGFVINKFRGDISLLEPGLSWLTKKTGKPVLGVLPYLHNLQVAAEDAINLEQVHSKNKPQINVVVPVFNRISNHTDFDMLRIHPQVNLIYAPQGSRLPHADLIILPGSKSVIDDLNLIFEQKWERDIAKHLRYGGKLIGICGGFQMLGEKIDDPLAIESGQASAKGLGYLPIDTVLQPEKQLTQDKGKIKLQVSAEQPYQTAPVSGYQIHSGVSSATKNIENVIELESGQIEGMINEDNQVLGSYLHGLFDSPEALSLLLKWAGLENLPIDDYLTHQEREIDRVADMVEAHLDWDALSTFIE